MDFSTCYIDKSSERAIIADSEGTLWHLQGFIAITEYCDEDDNYLVKYKCIVDYNLALSKTYEAGDEPPFFAHIGDEIDVSRLFQPWSNNAFPYNEAPIDYTDSIERYDLKVLNNLARNDLSLIISKSSIYYSITFSDGTTEFCFEPWFVHDDKSGDFLFVKSLSSKEKYGRCPVIKYLAHIIFALRKILNNKDICFKDVYVKGIDNARLPLPDISDGFLDKINAEIVKLNEYYEVE